MKNLRYHKLGKPITMALLAAVTAGTLVNANALTYNVDGAEVGLFVQDITSVEASVEAADNKTDFSKNAAYIPPGFGTPESYIPNRAEQFINLAGTSAGPDSVIVGEGSLDISASSDIQIVNGFPSVDGGIPGAAMGQISVSASTSPTAMSTATFPTLDGSTAQVSAAAQTPVGAIGFTPVSKESYFQNGKLGTISVPSLGISYTISEGTSNDAMRYGAGHFIGSSIWDGNVCLAAHNRGTQYNFGKINTLKSGDKISITTVYGTRNYAVSSVQKVLETDTKCLEDSATNMITLVTCVMNEKAYRYVVQGYEIP